MKILSYRSSMPFDNRGTDGSPSISPSTQKSIQPFNNVTTINDILNGDAKIGDLYPDANGSWGKGEDSDSSFREKGDDYKRQERDMGILNSLFEPREKIVQKWKVKVPGGSRVFMSFDMARKYTREKNLPFTYVSRIAQNLNPEIDKASVIADVINKAFMVESIDAVKGVIETGSAFCVYPGYFITCAHVIKRYNKNKEINREHFMQTAVNLVQNGQRLEAYVIAVDPKLDIALLACKIGGEPLRIDDSFVVGEELIAIGSPLGYENNVTTGILGSVGRSIYKYEGAPQYMFVDVSILPGNSGGPVIKASNGKLMGMITLIVSSTEGDYGLNAALPSSYVSNFCKQNIKGY